MKALKNIRFSFVAVLAMAIAVMTSCSSNDPVSQIPDDVDFASVINIQKVADNLGVTVTDTDVKLPEDFEAFDNDIPEEINDIAVECCKAIKLDNIAVFGYIKTSDTPDVFVVAEVIDEKVLDNILTNDLNLDDDENEGFKIYTPESRYNEIAILVKDGLAWFVPNKKEAAAVRSINKIMAKADDKKLIENSGFKSTLNADNVCNIVVNTTPFVKLIDKFGLYKMDTEAAIAITSVLAQTKGYWLNYSADMSKTGYEMTCKFVSPEGEILTIPQAENINNDYLTFVPESYQSTIAMGLNNEAVSQIVDNLEKLVEENIRGNEKEAAKIVLDNLRNIDGTISVSFGSEELQSLIFGEKVEALNFVATIDLKSGSAKDAIEDIYDIFKPLDSNGEFVQNDGNGKLKFIVRNYGNISVEAWGDQIVISNNDIAKGNSNSELKSAVSGNQFAAYVGLKSFAELTDDACKFGAYTKATASDGEIKYILELTDIEGSMISAFSELGLAIDKAYKEYRDKEYRSRYNY